jgi:hypothetical protein
MSLFEGSTLDTYDHDVNDNAWDLFDESVSRSDEYPTNLVYSYRYDYQLEECKDQLDLNEQDMFGDENWVDLLEFHEGRTGVLCLLILTELLLMISRLRRYNCKEYVGLEDSNCSWRYPSS